MIPNSSVKFLNLPNLIFSTISIVSNVSLAKNLRSKGSKYFEKFVSLHLAVPRFKWVQFRHYFSKRSTVTSVQRIFSDKLNTYLIIILINNLNKFKELS